MKEWTEGIKTEYTTRGFAPQQARDFLRHARFVAMERMFMRQLLRRESLEDKIIYNEFVTWAINEDSKLAQTESPSEQYNELPN